MASRVRRILTDSLAGAAAGFAFIIAEALVSDGFSSDPAYNVGMTLGGALVGLLVGAIIGAIRKGSSDPQRIEPKLGANRADRTEWFVHDDAGERGPLKKPEISA